MGPAGSGPGSAPRERGAGAASRILDRRGFVKGALGVAGLVPTVSVLPTCDQAPGGGSRGVATPGSGQRTDRVVIVGAGVAGLAAAVELRAGGIDDVVVLEARDRIGGRVWTDTIGDGVPIDLGASWIHGVDGNPIAALADEHGIATHRTDWDNRVFHDSEAAARNRARAGAGEPPGAVRRAMRDFWRLAEEDPARSLESIHQAVLGAGDFGEADRRHLAYLLTTEVENEYAADLRSLSYASVDGASALPGDDVVFPGGYRQIVDVLATGVTIRRGHAVTAIDHTGSPIAVTTSDGATFEADWVIVTVPLGVLKNGFISFRPALPARHRNAISSLDMGLLNKAALLFDDVFWDKNVERLQYLSADGRRWAETINMVPYSGQPILLMLNSGDYATELERLSDGEVVAQAVAALSDMYADVPPPRDARITRWRSDPWAHGSYSFVPAGSSFAEHAVLGEPVGDRVFLAGEATRADHPATVHGAHLSGTRAARRIVDSSPPTTDGT